LTPPFFAKASDEAERIRVATDATTPDLPVAGTGIDIIEIERMERAIKRTPRIVWRLFSEQEQAYCQSKARPATHFALFFAAKEAVLKALGTGFAGMAYTDVEVDHDRFGRPVPVLRGHAQELADALGIVELQLSLSYTHLVGVASAVAIKQQDRPRKDEVFDPHAELARQFKEMRALLDDMDEKLKELDAGAVDAGEGAADNADAGVGAEATSHPQPEE
jgi:holo-[acyl-carrier protein] synthase